MLAKVARGVNPELATPEVKLLGETTPPLAVPELFPLGLLSILSTHSLPMEQTRMKKAGKVDKPYIT